MSYSEAPPSRLPRRAPSRGLLLAVLLLGALPACKRDEGPERLARAEAQYTDLVDRGVPLQDPAWEAVIAAYEAVPPDSKARVQAEQRLAVLRERRAVPLPRRPLSRPGVPEGGSPSLDEHGHPR